MIKLLALISALFLFAPAGVMASAGPSTSKSEVKVKAPRREKKKVERKASKTKRVKVGTSQR